MKKKAKMRVSLRMQAEAQRAVITIEGVIGWDSSAVAFCDAVDRARKQGCTELIVRINSPGGYCADGLAMGDKLRTSGMRTVGVVIGQAASMGSYLLECCETRRMHRNGTLMFHQPSAGIFGTVDEILTEAQYLCSMRDRMFALMGSRVGQSGAEFSAQHQTAKFYAADEALSMGLIDEITDETEEDDQAEPDEAVEAEGSSMHRPAARLYDVDRWSRVAAHLDQLEDPADPDEDGPADPDEDGSADPDEDGPADPEEAAPAEPDEDGSADPDEAAPAEPDEDGSAEPDESAPAEPDEDGSADPDEDGSADPDKDDPAGGDRPGRRGKPCRKGADDKRVTLSLADYHALKHRVEALEIAARGQRCVPNPLRRQMSAAQIDRMDPLERVDLLTSDANLAASYFQR